MKKKIKVAFFAETLKENCDGAVRTMYQIIDRIPKDQFEFLFICGDDAESVDNLPFKAITLPAITIPFNRTYKITMPFFANNRLYEQLDAFQPDVVHIATPSPLGRFALGYANQRNLSVISIYHTHFLSYIDYYLKNVPILIEPVKNRMIKNYRAFYDYCDVVYVPTTEMIKDLASVGHATSNLKLWQRGIDRQLFNPNKKDTTYLQQHTQNNKPNILFASRLVWEKNLETLIDLYQLNEAKNSPYNILVAGDGVAKESLKNQMPNAFFFGQVEHEDLAVLYASADIFFFPSITETYGNVVVEAMASGLPCVIANGGGSKSFIIQGFNGFVCEPTNAAAYFEKIDALLYTPKLYKQVVTNGLAYTQQLNWEDLVHTYFQDLRQLTKQTQLIAA